jgi:hypothetical protein
MKMSAALLVNGNAIRPSPDEIIEKPFGRLDHEVHIEGKRRSASQCANHPCPHREVWNEVPIHDVHMDPVRPCPLCGLNLLGQATEVG